MSSVKTMIVYVSNLIFIEFKFTQLNPVHDLRNETCFKRQFFFYFFFIRFAIMHMRTKPTYTDDTKYK